MVRLNLRNEIRDFLKINIEEDHKRYISDLVKRSEIFKPRNIEL